MKTTPTTQIAARPVSTCCPVTPAEREKGMAEGLGPNRVYVQPEPRSRVSYDSRDTWIPTLERDGGFSYDVRVGRYVTTGYAVSVRKDLERILPGMATKTQIEGYIFDNAFEFREAGNVLGVWYDDANKQTWLDVSVVVPSEVLVRQLALEHNQVAYYDFDKRQVVYVNRQQQEVQK